MRTQPVLVAVLAAVAVAGCSTGSGSPQVQPALSPASTPTPSPAASVPPPPVAAPAPSPTAAGPVAAQMPPALPEQPAALAAQLAAAEQTIRISGDEAAVARAGVVQQAAYRVLAANPDLRRAVLPELPPEWREVAQDHVTALAALRRLTRPQPRLPAWRIVPPPPAVELLGHYRAAAQEFGIGWEYLAAIHLVETRMGRIRGTSTAGARGPMQFMPGTWDIYGEGDIEDPRDAIRAAARYLRASGAPRDMSRALFAYNRSEAYVAGIEMHAAQMRADERAYRGYYHWQVYYRTTAGDRVLPVGYDGRPA